MLVSALDSHPEILCFGELLQRRGKPLAERKFLVKKLRRFMRDQDTPVETLEQAVRFSPERFLAEHAAKHPKLRAVGFKFFLAQDPELINRAMREPNFRFIYLTRPNRLATYSSQKIADATGVHNVTKANSARISLAESPKVRFDEAEFRSYCEEQEELDRVFQALIDQSADRFHRVRYDQLAETDCYARILEFLGVDGRRPVVPGTRKIHTDNLFERFENPEVVERILRAWNRPEWLAGDFAETI